MVKTRSRLPSQTSHIPLSTHIKSKIALVWVKTTSALYGKLSLNVLREVCQFIAFHPLLVLFTNTELVIFDPAERQFHSCTYKPWFVYDIKCEFVCIGDDQIFMCGGRVFHRGSCEATPTASVFSNNDLIRLKDMSKGRLLHGLFHDETLRVIFAFGGWTKTIRETESCEEYSIANNSWSPLPNMNATGACTQPCGYQGKVYICPINSDHCEVFTTATRQFERVQIPKLPVFTHPIVWANQLIIVQRNEVRRLNIRTYDLIEKQELPQDLHLNIVLLYHGLLLNVNFHGYDVISLETLKKESEYPIDRCSR